MLDRLPACHSRLLFRDPRDAEGRAPINFDRTSWRASTSANERALATFDQVSIQHRVVAAWHRSRVWKHGSSESSLRAPGSARWSIWLSLDEFLCRWGAMLRQGCNERIEHQINDGLHGHLWCVVGSLRSMSLGSASVSSFLLSFLRLPLQTQPIRSRRLPMAWSRTKQPMARGVV